MDSNFSNVLNNRIPEALNGNVDYFKQLKKQRVLDICKDEYGMTPLMYAVLGKGFSDKKLLGEFINLSVFSIFQWNSHIHFCNCAYGYSIGNFCNQGYLRTFLYDCFIVSNTAYTNYSAKPGQKEELLDQMRQEIELILSR